MKMANVNEAWGHLEAWYDEHTTKEDHPISVEPMKTMSGYGGWVFRVDYEDRVGLVRVGPRGGLTWLIVLTDEQIQELR